MPDEAINEFEGIFGTWQDAEQMYACCVDHLDDLRIAFGYEISPEEAADELMDEAEELLEVLVRLGKRNCLEQICNIYLNHCITKKHASHHCNFQKILLKAKGEKIQN